MRTALYVHQRPALTTGVGEVLCVAALLLSPLREILSSFLREKTFNVQAWLHPASFTALHLGICDRRLRTDSLLVLGTRAQTGPLMEPR